MGYVYCQRRHTAVLSPARCNVLFMLENGVVGLGPIVCSFRDTLVGKLFDHINVKFFGNTFINTYIKGIVLFSEMD